MHLAALAIFIAAISVQYLGWEEKQHAERVPIVGNDELPGFSAKLPPAKPQKSGATVR